MKFVFLLFCMTTTAYAHVDSFTPVSSHPKLSKVTFDRVVNLLQDTFSHLAETNSRKLEFLTDYKSDWAQSFARRWETDQVIVYGGIAAIKNVTEDVLALGLCHELGHLYGGPPWGDEYNHLSLEGQADYWSATCFKEIVEKLSVRPGTNEERLTGAALVLTAFYAANRSLPYPQVDTPDPGIATDLLRTHPAPQCRLDTILRGLRKEARPSCWYKI